MTQTDPLKALGLKPSNAGGSTGRWWSDRGQGGLASINPATGDAIAEVQMCTDEDYQRIMHDAREAFARWRTVPAPDPAGSV